MRMAKAQNLSHNPAKISGQCGKLLCCLSYESDQYEACRKRRQDGEGCQAPCAAGDAPRPVERREPAPRPAEPASADVSVQGEGAVKRKRKKKRRSKNDQA